MKVGAVGADRVLGDRDGEIVFEPGPNSRFDADIGLQSRDDQPLDPQTPQHRTPFGPREEIVHGLG